MKNHLRDIIGTHYDIKLYDQDEVGIIYRRNLIDHCIPNFLINYFENEDEKNNNGFAIYSDSYFEIPIKVDDFYADLDVYNFTTNNHQFSISRPSFNYFSHALSNAMIFDLIKGDLETIIDEMSIKSEILQYNDTIRLFERYNNKVYTLKINTKSKVSYEGIYQLYMSYFFSTITTTNLPIDTYELPTSRHQILSRKALDIDSIIGLKKYDSKLVHRFIRATNNNDPQLSYISFYQIIEHFTDYVIVDNVTKKLKGIIDKPNFSTNKSSDMKLIIDTITNQVKDKVHSNDLIPKSELNILTSLIQQRISIDQLLELLEEYDFDYFTYYSMSKGKNSFCNAPRIRFDRVDLTAKSIAERIYALRNSLVHSKAFNNNKYDFAEHTNELLMEIPLIKAIAQILIIGNR